MRLRFVFMVFVVSLVAACSQPAPVSAPKPDLTLEERAVRDMDARWLKAAQDRDAAAEAAIFVSFLHPTPGLILERSFAAFIDIQRTHPCLDQSGLGSYCKSDL